MTHLDTFNDGVPGQSGHSVLSRLIGISEDEFADRYWGRQALLSTAQQLLRANPEAPPFTELLSSDAVDELVSERGLRTPFLRVAQAGSTLPERAFTAPGGVGAGITDQISDDKLVKLFAEGSTMVLQGLHRNWPPIIALCQSLAERLGHPVQANAYVTPPQNQGFSNHYDVHDVFVLQLEGEKRWQIHPPVLPSPLRDQPWSDRKPLVEQAAQEPPLIDTVLRPGDCLYLPRGFLHAAEALGHVSTHLTIGVHSWTRFALAEKLVASALRTISTDPELRMSLPLGVDFTDPSALRSDNRIVAAALRSALSELDHDQVSRPLQQQARNAQRASPVGPLAQLRAAETLAEDTELTVRPYLGASWDQRNGRSVLLSRAGDHTFSEEEAPMVKQLVATGSATVADLGPELARRLLLSGLAVTS